MSCKVGSDAVNPVFLHSKPGRTCDGGRMCLFVEQKPIGNVHNNVQSSRRSRPYCTQWSKSSSFCPLEKKMNHLHSRKFAGRESREKAAAALKIPENALIFFCSDWVIEPARSDMGNVGAVGFHRRQAAPVYRPRGWRQPISDSAVGKQGFSHRSLALSSLTFFFFCCFF